MFKLNILPLGILYSLIISVYCDSYGTYPSTYPFVTPSLAFPTDHPDYTYSSTDPGGYHYQGGFALDWLANQTGPVFHTVPQYWGTAMIYYSLSGGNYFTRSTDVFNCSKYVYTSSYFLGTRSNVQLFKAGSCCKAFWGVTAWNPASVDIYSSLDKSLTLVFQSGGCDVNTLSEQAYCASSMYLPYYCNQYYTDRINRFHVFPCADSAFIFYISCPILKVTGLASYLTSSWKSEPIKYISKMSISQTIVVVINDYYAAIDRVCHPLSYYQPNAPVVHESPAGQTTTTSTSSFIQLLPLSLLILLIF